MKRLIYLLIFTLFAVESFGQIVTQLPEIDNQSSYETDITKVELRNEFTIIHFRYQYSRRRSQNFNFPLPYQRRQPLQQSTTISINPDSYLSGNGKRFKYIRASGIVELPDAQPIIPGEIYTFKVYYERLDPGIELFNLIEGKNSPEQKLQFWNFTGIHIRNPLRKTAGPSGETVSLIINGRLIDARTQKTIGGKVVYTVDSDSKKTGYRVVQPNAGFSFTLKPDVYTFKATAEGYESVETNMDLSKLKKGQQFTQDIYLNPAVKKTPLSAETKPAPPKTEITPVEPPVITAPKIEPPREESAPVKVEENKFRLDKVYFNTGESGILAESHAQLNGLLKMMKDSPTMTIVIEGHTDNIGDPVQNKRLSFERAFKIREYLISKGIVGKRIRFKGYGDVKPIADNSTEDGRKQNRRVEFVIVNP